MGGNPTTLVNGPLLVGPGPLHLSPLHMVEIHREPDTLIIQRACRCDGDQPLQAIRTIYPLVTSQMGVSTSRVMMDR